MSNHFKPKKHQDQSHRGKPIKNNKNPAEEYLPFAVRPDRVSAQNKQLIFELEQEYIKRHNVLVNNRSAFASIIESIATELDGHGVDPEQLAIFFREFRSGQATEERTQAE